MTADTGSTYDALIQFLYQAPIGLLQTDVAGEITMINPMSAQLLMPLVPDGSLINLFDVLDPVAPQLRQLAAEAGDNGGVVCDGLLIEMAAHGPAGSALVQTLSLRLIKLNPETLMATVTDATGSVQREQQRLATKLKDASRTDSLTALPNRAVAMERIASALAKAQADADYRFAVICINCDRFDRVNVTLGSAVGDELLRLIGGRLNSVVRTGDSVSCGNVQLPAAARLGSDEFVLVVQGIREADDAQSVAQRVVDALAKPYAIGEHLVHISASVGIVLRAQAEGDPEEVLQNANFAMHEAKRAGGARYGLFDPLMKAHASRLGSVESELRQAIHHGQLFVVYQPIVEIASGECTGVEALVRWRHPVRGIVPPIEFIDIAEETGLIGALGEYVLNESCRQFVHWQIALGAHAPSKMSVNLSRAQLADGTITAQVRQALRASGMSAQHLQLEVTESLAAQDNTVSAQLHELKTLGVTLALDDFGTGYSSLSSLHQLPVDVVKIDRSFVSQLESSPHHRVLVEATVKVARSLGMHTVAEGIETTGQWAALQGLCCDKGQGYLFSRPLTADDATAWLVARACASAPEQSDVPVLEMPAAVGG